MKKGAFVRKANNLRIFLKEDKKNGEPLHQGGIRGIVSGNHKAGEEADVFTTGVFLLEKDKTDHFDVGDYVSLSGNKVKKIPENGDKTKAFGVVVRDYENADTAEVALCRF